jgi:hypothetical protein
LAIVALLLFPVVAFAQPVPPCNFYGTVQVDGADVVDGTVITATVGEETYSTTTTDSKYVLKIEQPEGKTYAGETVTFKMGDYEDVAGTATWERGGNVNLDLSISTGAPPSEVPISDVVVNLLPAGEEASATYDAETKVLTLNIPAGEAGEAGPAGPAGEAGPEGPAGPAGGGTLAIVALIIAIVAIVIGIVAVTRKPSPKK